FADRPLPGGEVGVQSPGRERAATSSRDERWRSRKRGSPLPASPIFDGGGEVSEPRSEERGAETCSRNERWRRRRRVALTRLARCAHSSTSPRGRGGRSERNDALAGKPPVAPGEKK